MGTNLEGRFRGLVKARFWQFPGGTEENYEGFQDIRFSFGDSCRVPFKHEYTAIPQQ